MVRFPAILAALLLLPLPARAAPSYVAGLNAFMAAYHCPIYGLLKRIHAHAMTAHERFVMVESGLGQRYVQCLFVEGDRHLLCEASSGFYGPKPRHTPSAGARQALAALGFDTNGHNGNYQRFWETVDDGALWDASGIMIEALYRAYGAHLGSKILTRAPLVPVADRRDAAAACKAHATLK